MNWLQTNGVIYLPVVVKRATRVGGNVRRGAPSKHDTFNVGTMLCQRRRRWPNNVPALGERLLFATSWKGTVLLYRVYRPAYQTR